METNATIFERTYRRYLRRMGDVSFESAAKRLGAEARGNGLVIPFFSEKQSVSPDGIADFSGKRPDYDVCVILSRHVLMAPAEAPSGERAWASFRDFKDAAPLTGYFAHEAEGATASFFSGRLPDLKKAAEALGAYPPDLDADYDLAVCVPALPRVPMALLFNDADDEFAASCAILFDSGAPACLDAECLAMLGRRLFVTLKDRASFSHD
ncbi:conserved hypothetical protein [Candidatus Desulfarcum epimagneticum]|uniref:DUF3786 domain-containing protein n=1 Tax=uncultured Desulfobacteraceae bacterium TaxID=218296 RepID=A0A484HR06_9BACT|nr:conserved hypothetical protein [uncultured Desulfobacteraceae bacterium]